MIRLVLNDEVDSISSSLNELSGQWIYCFSKPGIGNDIYQGAARNEEYYQYVIVDRLGVLWAGHSR